MRDRCGTWRSVQARPVCKINPTSNALLIAFAKVTACLTKEVPAALGKSHLLGLVHGSLFHLIFF